MSKVIEKKSTKSTASKSRYTKKDPIGHILDRSDMYVGSTRLRNIEEFIAEKKGSSYSIFRKMISTSPAILRIFVEPLSNAIDNVARSKKAKIKMTKIYVNIDPKTGETSIWNDGDIVPIEKNEEEDCYNHSLIFGQLLTGSNYDDTEDREDISGRNGLGVKLTNVFSTNFKVEGVDPKNGKKLVQEWSNNMRETTNPKVTISKEKIGYTKVTWTPDFSQFGMKKYSPDIVKLYTRYVIDTAMLSKVKVYLNDDLVPVDNLLSYAKLYDSEYDDNLLIKTKTSEVLITPSDEYQTVSFVNGVYTRLGGQHVDSWSEAIFRPIVNEFNKKKNRPKIDITNVKRFFRLFIVSSVVRPEFDGQDKNKLESPAVTAEVKKTHISKIMKWSVMDNIEEIIKGKEMVVLKKVERKRGQKVDNEDYERANNEGGKYASECTLIFCEGLSAKTCAVAGIQKGAYGKSGRDWFGIYPLTGKFLNVREKEATLISKNKVVTEIIQVLNLKYDVDYTLEENFKKLRYGKIMIMTDADKDGIHIEGLLQNFIHAIFPSLFKRKESFIVSIKTPIARVFKPRSDLLFYDERKFRTYVAKQGKGFGKKSYKYYKGLGTINGVDVPDIFGEKIVEYENDEDTDSNMIKVFHKKYADARKEWLGSFDVSKSISLDDMGKVSVMKVSDFLNYEMIKFSHASCKRGIPNLFDGFKESQRKIYYGAKKKKLKYSGISYKVAQFSGYVAEHTEYEHGEQNLPDTIHHMAQEFVGSNNIPLFYRGGQLGTRSSGGKDAASGRYTYTKMDMLSHLIFREEDDPLLDYRMSGDDKIEPYFYVPIIPMILVNGCRGIGTGWSSDIPCYNPIDLIAAIKVWLEQEGEVIIEDEEEDEKGEFGITRVSLFPEIHPWYRGFTGKIEKQTENRYITKGTIDIIKGKYVVSELPIATKGGNGWINNFRNTCEKLEEEKQITSYKNYSTQNFPYFIITESKDGIVPNIENLKLSSYIYTSNMVLFNEKEQPKKYKDVDEILDAFCVMRYLYYGKRKKFILAKLKDEETFLRNKARFIREVMSKERGVKLDIMNVEESLVVKELDIRKYDKYFKGENEEEEEEVSKKSGYDYLLDMKVRTFTAERVKKMNKELDGIREKIKVLDTKSLTDLWIQDLNEFENEYKKWLKVMEGVENKEKKSIEKHKK